MRLLVVCLVSFCNHTLVSCNVHISINKIALLVPCDKSRMRHKYIPPQSHALFWIFRNCISLWKHSQDHVTWYLHLARVVQHWWSVEMWVRSWCGKILTWTAQVYYVSEGSCEKRVNIVCMYMGVNGRWGWWLRKVTWYTKKARLMEKTRSKPLASDSQSRWSKVVGDMLGMSANVREETYWTPRHPYCCLHGTDIRLGTKCKSLKICWVGDPRHQETV